MVFAALPVLVGAGGDAARSEHQRIVEFWTPERVAQAVPREIVLDGSGQFQLARPTHHRPGHGGGPPGGGGGDGGGGSVTGASWTGGGTIADTEGKVLFALGSNYYVCSATLVDDFRTGESLVLTAGHCVYDNENNVFATNWMFIPNYDADPEPLTTNGSFCSGTLYGCWTADALVVHDGFASEPGFTEGAILHDFAFAVLGPGGHSGNSIADNALGDQAIQFSAITEGFVHAFGYPHARPYNGTDLVYCAGNVGFDANFGNQTYGLACNMTGGASGGGWFITFNEATGEGTLMSVNSYKYSNDRNKMYGPKFNSDTQDVYNAAGGASSNTIVGP